MKVWKFVLDDPEAGISMPAGAEVISIAVQDDRVCLWALIDPGATRFTLRHFIVCPTGSTVPATRGRFIGTVFMADGTLVFHVWDSPA